MSRRSLFLDRDGVLNADTGYVHRASDFVVLPGVYDALRRALALDYDLVVVTNQSGIGRALFTAAEYAALEAHMVQLFAREGITFAGIYHCAHHPAAGCACRKPAPGMILRAAHDHGIDLSRSIMVGDKPSDAAAARAAGIGRVELVAPGRGLSEIVAGL
ncbi:HAD family hydrolase [Croceibacterium sp. TMG7-5b_MA50]|uniref:D-glycero-alpha-D-manno-heptose-1,7-bisphosphate 7-phosphatase n=1 Tax=Croceibacterium sp. TMG7-5b_MA50 TaxID=3121290 RepID=UPI003221665D